MKEWIWEYTGNAADRVVRQGLLGSVTVSNGFAWITPCYRDLLTEEFYAALDREQAGLLGKLLLVFSETGKLPGDEE